MPFEKQGRVCHFRVAGQYGPLKNGRSIRPLALCQAVASFRSYTHCEHIIQQSHTLQLPVEPCKTLAWCKFSIAGRLVGLGPIC